ncbi:tetratricopeptide repeat protein [Candidatus Poribacteria bacterium]|nr:tetratricopeptide repeat protein [Candidatus Poribacteria bacterium]
MFTSFTNDFVLWFKKLCIIALPVLAVCVFLLPFIIGSIAKGQNDKVIEIEPGKPQTAKAAMKVAYVKHFDEEDFNAAITAYQRVISDFPDSPEATEAQFRIANVYHWNIFEPEKAIAEYQKVIDNYPNTDYAIESLIRMGEAYVRLKKLDKALEAFRKVIDNYKENKYAPQAKSALARTLLHELYKDNEAESVYKDILEHHPTTEFADDAKLWLIYIYQKKRAISVEEALKAYKALTEDMNVGYHRRASAQYMIAFNYCSKQDLDRAISEFKKLLNDYSEAYDDLKAETYYFIGHIYEQQEKYELAKENYKSGLELYPKSIWANHLNRRIERVEGKQAMALNSLVYTKDTVDYHHYLKTMENPDPDVYGEAIDIIGAEIDKRNDVVIDLLIEALQSPSENVRRLSASLLARVTYFSEEDLPAKARAEKVFHALKAALNTETRVVIKGGIAVSLGAVGVPAAIPILKQLVLNAEIERMKAIATHQESDVPDKGIDAVPMGAIRGLCWFARLRQRYTAEIVLFLMDETRKRLQEGNPRQRDITSTLLHELGQLNDRRGLDVIIEASLHNDEYVRYAAVGALESFAFIDRYPSEEPGYPDIAEVYRVKQEDRQRAEEKLFDLTNDKDIYVREEAEKALNAIRDADDQWQKDEQQERSKK